jgi:hypothetical protein
MGQRLVITVKNNGVDLAKIYYHWSAYSISALCEARDLVNYICEHEDKTEKELQLRLIRFCEENGGGIDGGLDSKEWKYIQNMFPNATFKSEGIDRSYGLIALSEKGMDDIQNWSEGDVNIILDEDLILNYVYFGYEDIETYKECASEWDDDLDINMTIEDVPDIGCDLCEISFDEIDKVIKKLHATGDYVVRNGKKVYMLIE